MSLVPNLRLRFWNYFRSARSFGGGRGKRENHQRGIPSCDSRRLINNRLDGEGGLFAASKKLDAASFHIWSTSSSTLFQVETGSGTVFSSPTPARTENVIDNPVQYELDAREKQVGKLAVEKKNQPNERTFLRPPPTRRFRTRRNRKKTMTTRKSSRNGVAPFREKQNYRSVKKKKKKTSAAARPVNQKTDPEAGRAVMESRCENRFGRGHYFWKKKVLYDRNRKEEKLAS